MTRTVKALWKGLAITAGGETFIMLALREWPAALSAFQFLVAVLFVNQLLKDERGGNGA